jgi:hypothetical protein
VTRLLGWITMTLLSQTLTVENFASAHTANTLVASAIFAIALAFMIAAAFVSRHPNTIADTAKT